MIDDVLIDSRWMEPGWLEVFRLRLTGWLPHEEAAAGIEKGVLKWGGNSQSVVLELSDRGAVLTNALPPSRTEENVRMIAEILWTLGFDDSWLKPVDRSATNYISEGVRFDASYRFSIISALKRDSFPPT